MRLNLATLQCIQLTERSSLRFKSEGPTGPWFSVKFGARCQPGRLCSGSLLKQKTWYQTGKSESPGPIPIPPGSRFGRETGTPSDSSRSEPPFPIRPDIGNGKSPVSRFGRESGIGVPGAAGRGFPGLRSWSWSPLSAPASGPDLAMVLVLSGICAWHIALCGLQARHAAVHVEVTGTVATCPARAARPIVGLARAPSWRSEWQAAGGRLL